MSSKGTANGALAAREAQSSLDMTEPVVATNPGSVQRAEALRATTPQSRTTIAQPPIGRRLRRLRRRRLLDADDVRSVTGWPTEHLEALESGAIAPLLSEVVTLAWLYRVELDSLRPEPPIRARAEGRRRSTTNQAPDAGSARKQTRGN